MIKQATFGLVKLALAFLVLAIYRPVFATEPLSVTSAPKSLTAAKPAVDDVDPREVFRPKIRIRDRFTAEITIAIHPGFYLYRDRMRVELIDQITSGKPSATTAKKPTPVSGKTAAVKSNALLALSIPNGKAVDDPTFGKVEVFETSVTILVDLSRFQIGPPTEKPAPTSIKVALISQGCAIAGICYPPHSHEFLLPLQMTTTANSWINPQNETSLRFGQARRPTQSSPSSSPSPSNLPGKTSAPSIDPAKLSPGK